MDIEEYIFNWMDISDQLKNHSNIQLLNWSLNTMANSSDGISKKEKELNCEFPEVLKEFYLLIDGLQLRWLHHNHPQFKEEYIFQGSTLPLSLHQDNLPFSGCINILPFDTVFNTDWTEVSPDWRKSSESTKKVSVQGKEIIKGELFSKLYPFDFYGDGATAAFYVNDQDFGVMISTQYFTDFNSYPVIDFETYLRIIQLDYGLFRKREFHFDKLRYNGYQIDKDSIPNIEKYDTISQFEYLL